MPVTSTETLLKKVIWNAKTASFESKPTCHIKAWLRDYRNLLDDRSYHGFDLLFGSSNLTAYPQHPVTPSYHHNP